MTEGKPSSAEVPEVPEVPEVACEVSDVHLKFRGVRALDGAALSVPTATTVGLVGPNGAGKTSLLNVLTGFYEADRGSVRILGRDVTGMSPEGIAGLGVARTFQTPQVLPEMNCWGNVLIGLHRSTEQPLWRQVFLSGRVRGSETEAWQRARHVLGLVKLLDQADAPAAELTLGERRRLEVARAIAGKPQLLLLDEPASGLSDGEAADLLSLLAEIRNQGSMTMIIVEHSMSFITDAADHLVVLDQGKVLAQGDPASVLRTPRVVEAYFGSERTSPTGEGTG